MTEFHTADDDTLLTTGEAALLLNSSRQHVVDLCNRGDLPFTTIGKHRRVRRSDVEAIRTRTSRMTRDQRRSLWLAHAIAGRLVEDPDAVVSHGKRNLEHLKRRHVGRPLRWLEEWERLLAGPPERILEVLTSRSPRARELRQNSPFAGVLDEQSRLRVLSAFPKAN